MKRPPAGVALITVLLVVAIATLAATALLSSSSIAIHRTAALRDSEQAWWVARGVEAWVLGILQKDAKDHPYDGLDEPWAQPVDHLPVDEGYLRGSVVDLQGRFNLNNLARDVDTTHDYQKQFERLLEAAATQKIEIRQGLVASIQDWIDADQTPGPGGAEDSTYMDLTPPYRTADRPFTVVSELLAVQGMTPELYAWLRTRVSALPETTAVNVNTGEPEVLAALSATTDQQKLSTWIEQRKEKPITNAQEMETFKAQGVFGADAKPAYLAYQTRYFQIQGEVFVGSSRVALYSLIHRQDQGTPAVLAHSADAE